ncbi:uncharacterized protein K02A2.6-like [Aedes albopictus]|uniref:Reverse transcriptase domain-containing protein n=1 Tax=Aedes albopictus TaxID=7160 RepID=A0ABM1YQB1_AEDAL
MATLHFNITPFVEHGDGPTSTRWESWRDQFVSYLALKGVDDHGEMYRALMCFGGSDVRKIAQNVGIDASCVLDNPYRAAMEMLDNYYAPRMSLRYERFKFRQLQFNPHETLDQFTLRLRSQASLCGFGDQIEEMMMDQIVFATKEDDKLRAKYLEADTSLDEMLKIGRTYESVKLQVREFRGMLAQPAPVEEVNIVERQKYQKLCGRCAGNHGEKNRCPARDSQCNLCRLPGHYARCCRRSRKFAKHPDRKFKKSEDGSLDSSRKLKFVREIDDVTNNVEVRELFHLNGKRRVTGTVGGVNVCFVVDTGADEDVLSEDDWKMLKRTGFAAYGVRKGSNKVFQAYGSQKPLTVLGEVEAEIKIGSKSCITTLHVIQNGKCSLLSGKSAEMLGVVKFLHALSSVELPYIKDMCASIKIDRTVTPVRQAYRRIPIPLEEITLLKLKELERQGIIERVHEASEWVSPMLVKRKSSDDVRIIIDLREANKAVIREVHPLPTMEQMISKLRGSTIFTKLDVKQAFHQLLLRDDCRYITTFISPLGLMRYKRLVFGLSAAPELFQKCMETILGDFPWLIVFIDDILIFAPNIDILKV